MSESRATLKILCQTLKLPTVAREATRLAEEAVRQGLDPLTYLIGVLEAEVHEREARRAARRLKEAGFPMPKTLESFDFRRSPQLPEVKLRQLAEGDYPAPGGWSMSSLRPRMRASSAAWWDATVGWNC